MYLLALAFAFLPAIFADYSPVVSTESNIALSSAFAVSSCGPRKYDLFVKGPNNALYHRDAQYGNFGNWQNLGGILTSKPAAVSLDCLTKVAFVRGTDNAVWMKWFLNGDWEDAWHSLGGISWSAPTAASWDKNRIDMFVRGTDNGLWQRFWTGGNHKTWSQWYKIGDNIGSNPSCVSWGPSRIDCFARSVDSRLIQVWWDGRWNTHYHETLGSNHDPIVASMGFNLLSIFIRRNDGTLKVKSWSGSQWSSFNYVPRYLETDVEPAVVSSRPGQLRIMLVKDGMQIHSNYMDGYLYEESEGKVADSSEISSIESGSSQSSNGMNDNSIFIPNALIGLIVGVAAFSLVAIAGLIVVLYKSTR